MKIITSADQAINTSIIEKKSRIYASGNAATPQHLLEQLSKDKSIVEVDLYGALLLGDKIKDLFSEINCKRITHRVLFCSYLTRAAVNKGWAKYHPVHLSEFPKLLKNLVKPNVVLLTVSGPDNGGNYSLGTTVEGVLAAVQCARKTGGVVIAERNKRMPFVLGTTISESDIDYLLDVDYELPFSPVHKPDDVAQKIGEIIAALYIDDGSRKEPGSTLQYGIGEVPEAVTEAILKKGVGDLGIHTELFSDAMIKLIQKGVITNRWKKNINFSVSSIFLSKSQEGYDWLSYNSSVQSRPGDYTNSVFRIAEQPKMVTINSALGVDLHGNIWADSLDARKIYSGVGGQSDFIRGAKYSEGGVAIIALKSTTKDGLSKIVDMCPEGITTTAIAADNVVIVSEYGALDPRGLSLGERAVGIAHLAKPSIRDDLLRVIDESPAFYRHSSGKGVPGFTSYQEAARRL